MKMVADAAALAAEVKSGRSVVVVHATWCPFCEEFLPEFAAQTSGLKGTRVLECVIDDESNPIWRDHAISVVPTLLFFQDGVVVQRQDGVLGVGIKPPALSAALERFAGA